MGKEIELVDLVDASGQIQKRGVSRTKAEQDPSPDLHLQIAIAVVFDDLGRVLVQKRALTKKSCPGDLDHVCGAVKTGETPEEAAVREGFEETGLEIHCLRIVEQGLNSYHRFRHLLVGLARGEPKPSDPTEIEWVRFMYPQELRGKQKTGELTFVDEFFQDMELALGSLK
jgi:8-oxo-dGTP pyrophosphatase MutT (NUDIX family)